MAGKKALAVSIALIVLAACAKNGIMFKRHPFQITQPKPARNVVRVYDHPKKPVTAEVKVAAATPAGMAAGDRVVIARPDAVVAAAPTMRPRPRKKTPEIARIARIFAPLKAPARPKLVNASLSVATSPSVPAKKTTTIAPDVKLETATIALGARDCSSISTRKIPARGPGALAGSKVIEKSMTLGGGERDRYVVRQVMSGNVPRFLRTLTPVAFKGRDARGKLVNVTVCVTPDYLAVGSDRDFVRVPMGLPAAAEIANKFGFVLPTTKIVDAIYSQAGLRLTPSPMQPGKQMTSTTYLWLHNKTVQGQLAAAHGRRAILVAGQKKDLVLSNVLKRSPHRVAIYGWHRRNGAPIQPLSTVHGEAYADYSHGIRLVSRTAFVNGKPYALAKLLEDPVMAGIISKEGPITHPLRLMAVVALK
ncbi:MAG: hypothetical protein ACE5DK_09190 [Paracoccaceae bacterium]